jgi:hypothetical protein
MSYSGYFRTYRHSPRQVCFTPETGHLGGALGFGFSLLSTDMYQAIAEHRTGYIGNNHDAYNNQGHDSALCEMLEPEDDGDGPPPT